MKVHNIYKSALPALPKKGQEVILKLAGSKNNRIEKIVSNASKSPEGFWYDQKEDEFVLVLQGSAIIEFEDSKKIKMRKGDYIVIPKNMKHRLSRTSSKPKCLWLTFFGNFKEVKKYGKALDK